MTDIREDSPQDANAPTRDDIDRIGEKRLTSEKKGIFARLGLFLRQIVDELRKVVRPTRSELLNYTLTVIVFVLVVMLFVSILDFGFGKLVLWVFGGSK